jgi:hypothetical protein
VQQQLGGGRYAVRPRYGQKGAGEDVDPLVGFALTHPEQAPLHHLKRIGFNIGQDKQQPAFQGRQRAVLIHREPAGSPRLPGHAKLTREWSQRYACLRSGRRTGPCNVAHTDTARLDCPCLALGCQAMFWPSIGSATRSTRRCALPHLIAPRGAQRSAPAPLHSARVMASCHPPSPS